MTLLYSLQLKTIYRGTSVSWYAVVCHIPGIVSVVFDKRIFAPWKMLTSTVCKLCIHIVFKFNLNSRSLFVPPVRIYLLNARETNRRCSLMTGYDDLIRVAVVVWKHLASRNNKFF